MISDGRAYIDPPFTPHSLLDALGEQVHSS